VRKGRLVVPLTVLLFLAACPLIVRLYRPQAKREDALWLTQEKFYQYIEGKTITLPGGEGSSPKEGRSLTVDRGQIESLRIEPGGEGPESEAAQVTFIVTTDQGRYTVQGLMSLHGMDGEYHPIVNLGKGWYVSPSTTQP
jgi:hypothetical protein